MKGKLKTITMLFICLLITSCAADDYYLAGLEGKCFKKDYVDLGVIRQDVMQRLAAMEVKGKPYGAYRLKTNGSADIYATCDAVLIRTMMGENFDETLTLEQRQQWIEYINSFADPSGVYKGGRHAELHRNGMVIGALGPLGGKQKYPVSLYDEFDDADEVENWLETKVDWTNFWPGSHLFWGGLHCFSKSKKCTNEWREKVFSWLDRNLDPDTGFWRKGVKQVLPYHGIGGGAHIWPIYQEHGHKFPYPKKLIDSILKLQRSDGFWICEERTKISNEEHTYYLELDALYGLKFLQAQVPEYRSSDIKHAVQKSGKAIMKTYYEFMSNDPDLHQVMGLVGTIGLLQQHDPITYRDKVKWTDIFSDARLYQTDKVETLAYYFN